MILNLSSSKDCFPFIKKYFLSLEKLFSISEDKAERLADWYIHDAPIFFNNRTWLQVWEHIDYKNNLDAQQQIDDCEVVLLGVIKRVSENITFENEADFFINYIRQFTGIFYMAAIIDIENYQFSLGPFTIASYLDPYELINKNGFYGGRIDHEVDFNKLIDSYDHIQLYLLSELFMYLKDIIEISDIGIRFWEYIYKQGIDEIIDA